MKYENIHPVPISMSPHIPPSPYPTPIFMAHELLTLDLMSWKQQYLTELRSVLSCSCCVHPYHIVELWTDRTLLISSPEWKAARPGHLLLTGVG